MRIGPYIFRFYIKHFHKWNDIGESINYIHEKCRCGAERSIVVAHCIKWETDGKHVIRDTNKIADSNDKSYPPISIIPPTVYRSRYY